MSSQRNNLTLDDFILKKEPFYLQKGSLKNDQCDQ